MTTHRPRTLPALRSLTLGALLFGAAGLTVFGTAGLTGCVIGNSAEVSRHRATTIGQELIDLERAKEEGLVTKEEYRRLRENIFEMAEPVDVDEDVYEHDD